MPNADVTRQTRPLDSAVLSELLEWDSAWTTAYDERPERARGNIHETK